MTVAEIAAAGEIVPAVAVGDEEEEKTRLTASDGYPAVAMITWAVQTVAKANEKPIFEKGADGKDTAKEIGKKSKPVQRRADATLAMQLAVRRFALALAAELHFVTEGATRAATRETVELANARVYAMYGRRRNQSHRWEPKGNFFDEGTDCVHTEPHIDAAPARKRKAKDDAKPVELKVKRARKTPVDKKVETVAQLPAESQSPVEQPPAADDRWARRLVSESVA